MKCEKRSLIEVHSAVFLFGIAGLFGKLIELPPTIIVLGRVVFASFFLGILLILLKKKIILKRKQDYFFLTFLGIILAIHWSAFFKSIQVSTVAIGLLTFSTFPVFVTFFEPLFFKEKLKIVDVYIACVTFLGVLVVIPSFTISDTFTQGALWGVLSGLTFAFLSILNRKYVKEYSSLTVAFYQDSIAAVILIPFLFMEKISFQSKDMLLLVLLGVIFTGIAHSLFIKGLSHIKTQTASIIASLEPVYGIVAAALLFHEIPTLKTIFGGMIILSMAFYASLKNSKG